MATLLQIYNRALDNIGEPGRLTSTTQATPACEALNRAFNFVLEEFIRSHPWQWATQRMELTADATAPTFGWTTRYAVPAGMVTISQLNGEDVYGKSGDVFVIESGFILTNETEAQIVGQFKPTDTVGSTTERDALLAAMDPLAVKALSTRLAAEIATVVRNDGQELASQLMQRYRVVDLEEARAHDGSEERRERYDVRRDSRLLAARYGRV